MAQNNGSSVIKSNTFDGGRHITRIQKLENEIQ
jgi:hypothetical protein